jgi:hypothetical protein
MVTPRNRMMIVSSMNMAGLIKAECTPIWKDPPEMGCLERACRNPLRLPETVMAFEQGRARIEDRVNSRKQRPRFLPASQFSSAPSPFHQVSSGVNLNAALVARVAPAAGGPAEAPKVGGVPKTTRTVRRDARVDQWLPNRRKSIAREMSGQGGDAQDDEMVEAEIAPTGLYANRPHSARH